ncbi:hypothetical protein GCM10027184_69560 [Saccharothrix stipae]
MVYAGVMRYADGGGLSERGRAKREQVRLQAAEWFGQDVPVAEIARRLRVSTRSTPGGVDGVPAARPGWRRKGPAGRRVGWTGDGWTGCPKPWSMVRPRTGSAGISAGPWPGSPI